jgi:signal transduction histidine kinase/DNA-binding response OmpR family regulator/ligand-binding sensor domain-containing protein
VFSHAQNFRFQQLSIEDGLKSNKVFQTIEDNDGFIWIATENGINKYDGRTLKSYSLAEIQGVQQRPNLLLLLDVDSNGIVWLVLNNGLVFKYDTGLDEFIYFDKIESETGNHVYVGTFHIDHNDNIIVGSFANAYIYYPDSLKSKSLPEITTTVKSVIQSSDNQYFIGSREGVLVFDENLKFLFNLKDREKNKHWIPENQVIESLFLQEAENKLWLGSQNSGLYFYDLNHDQLSSSDQLLGNIDLHIRSITDFGSGKLMVGTDGGGVFLYDTFKSEVLEQLVYNDYDENSLSSNNVYDIFVNEQGVVFISTFRGGVNIYNPKRQNFSSIRHQKGDENSLKNDVILSIEEPRIGLLSFGTDMGISLLNKSTDNWTNLSLNTNGENSKSEVAWSQSIDKSGKLWVASFIYSLSRFEPKYNQYILKSDAFNFLKNATVKKLYHHPNGEMLLGTINSGVFCVKLSGEVKNYPIQGTNDFETYSAEKVIIGNRNGIALLDLKYEEINWMDEGLIGNTLKNKAIISLLIDDERNLWVGTINHGVFIFNANLNEVRTVNSESGLPSNNIFDLVSDSEGNVWAATGEGLSKFEGESIANFYKSDGLISTDFNRNAALRGSDGHLYFGTNQGVITFNPLSIEPSDINKKLVLTDFYLNHARIIPNEKSALFKPLNETEKIVLTHKQNSFSIGFTSIDFVHPEQGEYTWKLEGFDPDWVRENNPERATYTNLNSGEYTFRLKLTDPLGNLLAPENQVSLMIKKPYWQTVWAYVLYLIFGALLIALLLYSNRLRLESKNAKERLHYLIEMAHEIKTPLTLIRAPITDLLNNSETDNQTKESLEVALKSADKLHKQMMQFIDFRKTDVRKNQLQIESVDLIDMLKRKVFAFKPLAGKKGIDLIFNPDQSEFIIKTDEAILDKIVSNLLSNAIKYTLENGKVTLSLESHPTKWTLSVKDTGIGISKEDQKKIFTLFYRAENARGSGITGSGVGLVLANDLAKTLGGEVRLEKSNLEGSEFVITIPLTHTVEASEFVKEKETEKLETQRIEAEVLNNKKVKILIVEDDKDLRAYQRHKFEHKYQIFTASNGEEALELVQSNPPDLIISDVVMPKMNGRQLCMNIKSNLATSHIPFMMLTGLQSKEHIQMGFESGADDYIPKPVDFEMLASKINNLLSTRTAFKDKFITSETDFEYQELTNQLDQQFLDKITQLVDDHISDSELSINFLCQSVGMSRTAFYHKLKSLVDMSPSEFIRTIRLKRARKLLLNSHNNISEVAYSTGFSNAKYFSTLFKKYYGMSPSGFVAEKRGLN